MSITNLATRFNKLIELQVRNSEILALTGKVRSDNSITLSGDSANGDQLDTNEIYVRLSPYNQQGMALRAVNIGVAARVNLWVYIRKTPRGEYEITRAAARENTNVYGSAAASAAQPQSDGSFLNGLLVGGINLLPGRLQLVTESSLVVCFSDFLYLDSSGALRKWTTSSGRLDLTASLPVTASQHTLGLIVFNPSATAPALSISTLTARAVTYPFNDTDLASFTLTAGYIPLATVRLVNGDTALTLDRVDYNVRQFLAPKPTLVGGSTLTRQTVSGTRFSNDSAIQSLLAALSSLGVITDNTVADQTATTQADEDSYQNILLEEMAAIRKGIQILIGQLLKEDD